ncbi:MAG: dihydroorotate dehydrogenase electron transfer subunit [Anaerohalosphaeraceae bacterium]|nr:dihydroorotate dehydrogenase electron transfer subunit [Anaerohalosphaeraceae bacterium]
MIHTASVINNLCISEKFYKLTLSFCGDSAAVFASAVPGQFAEFDLSTVSQPLDSDIPNMLADRAKRNILLRRPLSFSDIRIISDGTVEMDVLYCVVGPATIRMKTLCPGDSLSVIGPLGNGFTVPDGKKRALLVAGGMGTPPMQHIAKYLSDKYPAIDIIAFAGAKTITALPYFEIDTEKISDDPDYALAEFAQVGVKSIIATDDGSVGFKGFVTDLLKKWFADNTPVPQDCIIYACGPEAMLKSAAMLARETSIDCHVSLERQMACGIGLCQSCAVEIVSNDDEKVYKLCCKDGPVFDAAEVLW